MKLVHKTVSVFLCAIILLTGMGITGAFMSAYADSPTHTGTVKEVSPYLNVRSEPKTGENYIGKLYSGDSVIIYGTPVSGSGIEWYKISYGSGYGYVGASYIINIQEIPQYDYSKDFETHLTEQGFPESYKVLLRELHAIHPEWIFIADHTAMTWAEAVKGESVQGKNLVQHKVSSIPDSWKSMAEGAYTWGTSNPDYKSFDSGNWVAAEQEVIEYYLEPRNFLNEKSIYMFLDQSYNPAIQNKAGLQNILNGTFMEGAFPEKTYATYADVIMEAGKQSGVSPYVIAATIIVEQGVKGQGGCISGNVEGFKGYYNFFNINAYARNGRTAVTNGLRYASDIDNMKTYDRPWNTRAKSIIGGAKWYAAGYVKRGQNTLYYKKFNVIKADANGNYYTNQYMTNVQAAYSESSKLKAAYSGTNAVLTFNIPVYKDMPESNTTALPTSKGANNYYITSLSVNGEAVNGFNMFKNSYALVVANTTADINIEAAVPNGATVSGAGNIKLHHGKNVITLTVTAASGKKAEYTLTVLREGEVIAPTDYTGLYKQDGTWYYVSNGQVNYTYNSLCKYGEEWFYVENGMVNWTDKTLVKYGDTLFFVQYGKVSWNTNTLFKYDGIWYHIKNGQVAKTGKTLVKYEGTWFYVENGQVNWNDSTLTQYGDTLFYVQYGKVSWNTNTLFKYDGIWYHIKNGQVPKSGETLVKYNGTWFYVQNGQINWTAKKLVKYGDTLFYVKDGQVNWSYNGKATYNGKTYTVKGGQVKY